MRTQKRVFAASGVALTGILLITYWAAGDPLDPAAEPWSIGGSWIETCSGMDGSVVFTYDTLTPADATGRVFTYRQSYVNADPPVEGLLPEADRGGETLGTAVCTGPNTSDYTLVGHAARSRPGKRPEILGIIVFSGKVILTGPDTREDKEVFVALYAPNADVNPVDGLPDEDAKPLVCVGPMDGIGRRVGLMPACIPAPMPLPPQQ